jgi:hypothetical protein
MIHHRAKKREKGGKHFENKTLAHVGILFFEMLAEKLPLNKVLSSTLIFGDQVFAIFTYILKLPWAWAIMCRVKPHGGGVPEVRGPGQSEGNC